MTRTVSVRLEADVSRYVTGMGTAVTATKGLDSQLDKAAKGGQLDRLGEGTATLRERIKSAETSALALAKAFADTGDPKILAAWKQQGSVLADLKKVEKFLPDPAEALKFGQRLGDSVTKALPPQLTQALIAGGIAASPFLAATLVGAVTGGAGMLGIGGGVALALRDPKIKAEAKALGGFIDSQMRNSFGGFAPAMTESIDIVRDKVIDLRAEFDRIGSNSAKSLVPLVGSVSEALGSVVEGLDRVIGESGPTMAVIGEGIEGIGEAVEKFLNMTAENADVGAKALNDLFAIIEFGLGGLTLTVDLLAKAYKWGTAWTTLIPGMDGVEKASSGAAGGMGTLGKETEASGKKVEIARQKFVAFDEILRRVAERNLSAAEANIAMRQATKDLTEAVDKKTRVTDAESTALISFARTTNSASQALDEQGRTVGDATKAHEANRKKLIETAMKMGHTRSEAKKLADQYLATPKSVATAMSQPGMAASRKQTREYHAQLDKIQKQIRTSVTVTGDKEAYAKLTRLLVAQQAAKRGISVSAAQSAFNKNAYAEGGWTGPGSKYTPAGVVHADEFVVKADSRRRIERRNPGLLDEMNATGQVRGYASGGMVMPFPVNASGTKVMSMAQALAAVGPVFSKDWPSSPGAQRGDSGVWRQVLQLIKSGPAMGSFGNSYRPGDPKWHGSGRAVDWMGFNMDPLASFLASKRQLELIHRTNSRDYAYTRGVNKGSFSQGLMNAHRNHIHIAMANGGMIKEPIFGVGASGASYSFGEGGRHERVTPMGSGGGGGVTYNINTVAAPGVHPAEYGRQIVNAIQRYESGSGSSWRSS